MFLGACVLVLLEPQARRERRTSNDAALTICIHTEPLTTTVCHTLARETIFTRVITNKPNQMERKYHQILKETNANTK